MNRLVEEKKILKEISIQKKKLVEIAEIKGLHSIETIKCSQELDEMINLFYRGLKYCFQREKDNGA